ncbi:MAG: class I SAM-dependent methyltransferase [Bacteroidota bacterium]
MNLEKVQKCLVCNSQDYSIVETTQTMMATDNRKWQFCQCNQCNMVYLSPRVPVSSLDAYYTDSYLPYRGPSAWGRFSRLVEGDQKKIDQKRLKTVMKYSDSAAKIVLDFGCGKPSFLKLVKENSNFRCIGIDFSDKGWNDTPEQYKDIELHIGGTETLTHGVEADIITMWHYLEHDYAPQETLKTLSQTQKTGTKLIIEVPNYDSYSRKRYGEFWSGYHTPRHTGLYTTRTMKLLLESCGWEVLDQYSYGTLDPYTLDWMSRMEKNRMDWSASMESHFTSYVVGKMIRPIYFLSRFRSLGFMTVIAQNKE